MSPPEISDLNDRAPATQAFSADSFQQVKPQGGVSLYNLTVPENLKQPQLPVMPQHLKPLTSQVAFTNQRQSIKELAK